MKSLPTNSKFADLEQPFSTDVNLGMLRRPFVLRVMVIMILVWLLYTVSGFRNPTSPIMLSDSNAGAGIRQLVFASAGGLAFGFLFLYRGFGPLIALRLPYLALAGLLMFSVVWSEMPSLTIKRTLIFIFGLLTVLVLVHSAPQPARLMIRIVVYSSGVFALFSLFFYVVLPNHCTVNPARPGLAGIAVHPNTLGPFLSTGLLLSFGAKEIHSVLRMILRLSQVLMSVALFMTMSMTTIVTTFLGIGLYIILLSGKYRLGLFQIGAVFGCLLVAVIGAGTIKSSFFDATGRDESLSGRDQLWEAIGYEVSKNPVLGSGFGAFWTEGKGREITQTWNPRQSHHGYLDVMLDLGIIGLIVVLILFPLKLITSWGRVRGHIGSHQRRAMAAMYATVFCYLCFYSFSQSYLLKFDSYPFLVLVWVTLLVSNKDQNRIEQEFSNS